MYLINVWWIYYPAWAVFLTDSRLVVVCKDMPCRHIHLPSSPTPPSATSPPLQASQLDIRPATHSVTRPFPQSRAYSIMAQLALSPTVIECNLIPSPTLSTTFCDPCPSSG